MSSREKRVWTDALWVTVLHRIPASHGSVSSKEALLQARLACKIALSPILIHKTALLQIAVVCIRGAEYKLDVQVLIALFTDYTFLPNRRAFSITFYVLTWTACVARYLLNALVTLNFYEASSPKRCSHSRVSNRHAEIFLTCLGHEVLVEGLRLGCARACVAIWPIIVVRPAIIVTIARQFIPLIIISLIDVMFVVIVIFVWPTA